MQSNFHLKRLFGATFLVLGVACVGHAFAAAVTDAGGRALSAEVTGDHLYLLSGAKKTPAPDGTYKIDGIPRLVKGGLVQPGQAQGFNPQPEPPGKQAQNSMKPVAPGEAVGFNPQPEPPGKQGAVAAPAAQGAAAP
jgi:hypothetical protein